MTLAKTNLWRCITCLMMVMTLLLSNLIPASAAGVETWSKQQGPWESIRVTNNNWTPVKTMGRSGKLRINHFFYRCAGGDYCDCSDHEPASWSNIKLRIKIVNYDTGEVLADGTFTTHKLISEYITTKREVKKGERLRIFFDVSSVNNPPGPYRKGHIEFQYEFLS